MDRHFAAQVADDGLDLEFARRRSPRRDPQLPPDPSLDGSGSQAPRKPADESHRLAGFANTDSNERISQMVFAAGPAYLSQRIAALGTLPQLDEQHDGDQGPDHARHG